MLTIRRIIFLVFFCFVTVSCAAQTMVTFYTNMGVFVTEMTEDLSPITSGNFMDLANSNYYDDVIFHRIIDDFVIQGGDPTGTGNGGPGYSIDDEFGEGLSNVRGTLSMANSGPNTGGSQFFINLVNNVFLDPDVSPVTSAHPVFGRVLTNFDLVQEIGSVMTNASDQPIEEVRMDSVRVWSYPENGLLTYWSMDQDNTADLGSVHAAYESTISVANRFGEENSALLFTGSSFIDGGDRYDEFFIRENQAVSFALWFKPATDGIFFPLVTKHLPESCEENQQLFYIALTDWGGVEIKISGSTDGSQSITYWSAAGIIGSEDWTHLAFSYDPASSENDGAERAILYINKEAVALNPSLEGELFSQSEEVSAHFALGAYVDENGESCELGFSGFMDEFYFFNKILTEEDLDNVYGATGSGISDFASQSQVSPNPIINGALNVSLHTEEEVDVSIYNISGIAVKRTRYSTKEINISLDDFAPGVYLLQIKGSEINDVHRVVVE